MRQGARRYGAVRPVSDILGDSVRRTLRPSRYNSSGAPHNQVPRPGAGLSPSRTPLSKAPRRLANVRTWPSLPLIRRPRGRPMGSPVSYRASVCGTPLAPPACVREAGAAPAKPRLLDRVRFAFRLRHYSRRTEDAYVACVRSLPRQAPPRRHERDGTHGLPELSGGRPRAIACRQSTPPITLSMRGGLISYGADYLNCIGRRHRTLSYPSGCQTVGASGAGAEQVPAGGQSEDRQNDRRDDSAIRSRPRRSGDPVAIMWAGGHISDGDPATGLPNSMVERTGPERPSAHHGR